MKMIAWVLAVLVAALIANAIRDIDRQYQLLCADTGGVPVAGKRWFTTECSYIHRSLGHELERLRSRAKD